jgi:hypothetical protein
MRRVSDERQFALNIRVCACSIRVQHIRLAGLLEGIRFNTGADPLALAPPAPAQTLND